MNYIEVAGKYSAVKFLPSGDAELIFQVPAQQRGELLAGVDEILKKGLPELQITVKKKTKKRSLDCNAYAWVLIDKLAAKLNITKEEVYKSVIREIGGVSEVCCVQNEAVEKLCETWKSHGIGWQTETMPSKIEGCTIVVLYYGSSVYTAEQMHRLVSKVVDDCKEQGVETMPPAELDALMNEWGEKK